MPRSIHHSSIEFFSRDAAAIKELCGTTCGMGIKMKARSLVAKTGWRRDFQQMPQQPRCLLECEVSLYVRAHEPATGYALFRAILCLDLAIFLESEAAHQRERSRYLVRLGRPWRETNQSRS